VKEGKGRGQKELEERKCKEANEGKEGL